MNGWVSLCVSIYRRFARAFPHEFHMIYGQDLERTGEDAAPEIWKRHGILGLVRLLADIAVRVPMEYLAEFRQDVVYASRTLTKSPAVAVIAILSLAIGMGLCITFFAQMEWLTAPIPVVRDPQALFAIEPKVSYPHFERYRDQQSPAESVMAFMGPVAFGVVLDGAGDTESERVFGHLVSPEYFTTLGVNAAMGRIFDPGTEKRGAAPAVVISDRFWRGRLDSDPEVIGRSLRLNGQTATIVGVTPKDFAGVWPSSPADVFIPVTTPAAIAPELSNHMLQRADESIFSVVFRVPRGSESATEAAIKTITETFDRERGAAVVDKTRRLQLILAGTVMPLNDEERRSSYAAAFVLGGLVLLLACANLANLVVARGTDRRKEIAIRLAVGASRMRLVRQVLAESLLLSFVSAIGALIFAHWLLGFFKQMAAAIPNVGYELGYRVDFYSFIFAIVVAVVAGAGFGLAPAFASTRADLAAAMKEGAATPLRGYRRFGIRNVFVVSQVAASLTMLLLTSYLVVGFEKTSRRDPGFDTRGIYLFQLDAVRNGFSGDAAAQLFEKLPEVLANAGSVTYAESAPLIDVMVDPNTRVTAPRANGDAHQVLVNAVRRGIGPGYFRTLGIPLVRGTEFSERDVREADSSAQVAPVILNQTAARNLFGTDDPIGRTIREGAETYTVLGVARDTKSAVLLANPIATIYVPAVASARSTIILHAKPDTGGMTLVRRELAAFDGRLTVFNARTLPESVAQSNTYIRLSSAFYLGMGLFGLILSSIGLAGVTSYAVSRRRKEIGIRMALGARSRQVLQIVLQEGATLVVVGSVFGFAGAFAASRALSSQLDVLARSFAIATGDLRLLIGAPLILITIALAACYIPARRSTRISPLAALREE